MKQDFQIVNLAHENKLIYINSYLNTLKGVAIAPVPIERSNKIGTLEKGDIFLRTFPIVGEDWQVIDDEWTNPDVDYGFNHNILGRKGDTIHVGNEALTNALIHTVDYSNRTVMQILEETRKFGVNLTDENCQRTIHLDVSNSYLDGCYYIGNEDLVMNELELHGKTYRYPVPDLTFRFDGKDTPKALTTHIFAHDDLLSALEHYVKAYANFFHRSHLRLTVTYDNVPTHIRKELDTIIQQVNDTMDTLDDVNNFEPELLV